MKVQLRRPFFPNRSIIKIKKDIENTLKTGTLTLGENLQLFERRFAKFQKMRYACAVSSGTAGLHLALLSIGVSKGDEVIVPTKTFISTANAALYCNATPIFCDVDDQTFQIDPFKLKKLITKKTKAIIPVHLGGNICLMNEILEIGQQHDVVIVEDAAHAHGSTMNRKKAGSFGTLGIFSFYPDKILASSDGGLIVTNDHKLYEKLTLLRNVGRERLGKYDFSLIGYNYRMNEIQAIIANEQLNLLKLMIDKRRKIASNYDDELGSLEDIMIQKINPGVKSSYYAYILRLMRGNLNKLRMKLAKLGIETSPMFTSLHKTKPYVDIFGRREGLCPVSEQLDNETFTIPLHPAMNSTDINFVIKSLKKFVN